VPIPHCWPHLQVGLQSAGDHLAAQYGNMFRTVWAVGLLASGQVATIGLTFAGQLVMSGLLGIKVGWVGTERCSRLWSALVHSQVLARLYFVAIQSISSNAFVYSKRVPELGRDMSHFLLIKTYRPVPAHLWCPAIASGLHL
jgi:hypothetical protein